MKKLLFSAVIFLALGAGTAVPAVAGELKLSIANGRVTLIAQDVPVRQILAEWARIGQTQIVNGDKLTGPLMTLQLVDVPERQALDILLHSASGYVAAPRAAVGSGASLYDRIMILPTSRPPAVSASATPQPFTRQPVPQPQPQPMPMVDDDDGEPADQGVVPPPGVAPPVMSQPGMMPTNVPNAPNGYPTQPPVPAYPGATQPGAPQVPITAPRPGMLPAPPAATPGNPYQPYPQQQPPVIRKPGGGE